MDNNLSIASATAAQEKTFSKSRNEVLRAVPENDLNLVGAWLSTDGVSQAEVSPPDAHKLEDAGQLPTDIAIPTASSENVIPSGAGGALRTVIQAVNAGGKLDELLEETAAGNTANGSDSSTYFVRLAHVLETLDSSAFQLAAASDNAMNTVDVGAIYRPTESRAVAESGGNHLIPGGSGNETLFGSPGSDVFHWQFGDQGSVGAPAIDTINNFSSLNRTQGGDVLDLRDLLQGETHTGFAEGNLTNYLHFEHSGSDTIVHVSSAGQYVGAFDAQLDDQRIHLSNADLLGGATADTQIIRDLLAGGKLIVD